MTQPDINIVQATIQTANPAHCNIHVYLPQDDYRFWHTDPIPVEADEILESVERFVGAGADQARTGRVVLWTRTGYEKPKREDLHVVHPD